MKYNWKTMTDEKKDMAIRDELTLSTHMGTTKDDFIEIMRYQSEKLTRQPRFSEAEREALDRVCNLADNGADAQARSMKSIGAWTEKQQV
jgi:hypothetical protein